MFNYGGVLIIATTQLILGASYFGRAAVCLQVGTAAFLRYLTFDLYMPVAFPPPAQIIQGVNLLKTRGGLIRIK
jgi:hypothetical protein